MAEKLDSKEISSFEELLMSNVYTQEALGGFFIIICQKCDNKLTQKLIPKNCVSIPLIPNSLFCILKPPQSEFLSIQFSGLRVLGMGREQSYDTDVRQRGVPSLPKGSGLIPWSDTSPIP